jgi:hypothetical protein
MGVSGGNRALERDAIGAARLAARRFVRAGPDLDLDATAAIGGWAARALDRRRPADALICASRVSSNNKMCAVYFSCSGPALCVTTRKPNPSAWRMQLRVPGESRSSAW